MRVDKLARVGDELLDELGVASTGFYSGELERIQLALLGHGTVSYLVARNPAGRAVGLIPVYTARPPWHPTTDPDALPAAGSSTPLCLAGSYAVYGNYFTVATSVPGRDAASVACVLAEQVHTLARKCGCEYVMLPYLGQAQGVWLDTYRNRATAVTVRQKAVLRVAWASFEDYVAWLPSRRRTPVRRERRRLRESGIEVRERRVREVAGELAPLLAATERLHRRDADPHQIEFHYTLLGMHLADDFVALVAYLKGRPVACSLLLACGNRWISKAWGCDYASVGNNCLYFNLLFYEPVIRAIERGIEVIDYGVGALEVKTQRGCAMEGLQSILMPTGGGPVEESPWPMRT